MPAVVFTAAGELTVAERPEPVPGPRQVVIETAAVGICGTDTHVLDGTKHGRASQRGPQHSAASGNVSLGDDGARCRSRADASGGLPGVHMYFYTVPRTWPRS